MYLMNFWETLIEWDRKAFLTVNGDWTNSVFDSVMPFLRNSSHWVPLYTFLLFFMALNFRNRGLWWCLFFLVTVSLTDMIGNEVFKKGIERLRPCNDPSLMDQVRLVIKNCGAGYSFISNHAANHFGMATFFFVSFRHISRTAAWIGVIWAFSIAYAQVYVGIHFPLDVISGALLGISIGSVTGHFFNKRFGITIFDHQPIV
jgi:membrane-associated phospholipid phosphatase